MDDLHRIFDPVECRTVTDKHLDYFTFDVEDWIAKPENYAVKSGNNVAFGEYKSPGVYWVHFCFDTAKGREAINLTKAMLTSLYETMPIKTAVGLINEDNRKARWLIFQVGFKSLGMVETKDNGLCEMFYWTKEDQE
jgi:hypothetical protein